MKAIFMILGVVCFILAAAATPIGIGYGVYQWAVEDIEFKIALWAGVKTWITMLLAVIPGLVFYGISL